ncbi:MAG TPA: NAD-dependent epimerase/dehydratase family protein, partial [Steroidobacteraceae bacterium]|nr:NAD-dependent epimerase/dehydratase family protein [Steroidobacteraceae bacterium]
MNRRNAIELSLGAAVSALSGAPVVASAKPARVLILGGTGFIGPHFVAALTAHGHSVTLFNRGRSPLRAASNIEQLVGDRNGQVAALKGRDWDAVIDDSGYTPREVRLTATLLESHVAHYIFISSISAYADLKSPGIDENYPLAKLKDPTVEAVTADTYGGLKALCESVVEHSYPRRCAIIRPTFIAGPGDPTDRFTYWPVRVSRGGEMLAPGAPRDPIQFIDVRDLADFVRACVERGISGRYNVCTEPRAITMGMLLDLSNRITGADTEITWAGTRFLEAQRLIGPDSTGRELPIWVSPTGDDAGAALVSCARAVAKGLRFRPLEQTITDTLAWQRQRTVAEQTLRAGLTPQREVELLRLLHQAARRK